MNQARLGAQAFAWAVLGLVAVVLVTVILKGAVSSNNADNRTEELTTKLEKVTHDLTALRDEQEASKAGTLKARATLMHQNRVTAYQLRVTQQQNRVLIRLLRAKGIQPPPATLPPDTPSSSPSAVPKAPRRTPHRSPGSPAPTAPSPSAPSPSQPVPPCPLIICVGVPSSLPSLLPSLF